MSAPIPEHGTRACYLRGCRRPECSLAHRRYCKRYQASRVGRGDQRVDAAAAAKRCQELVAQGWSGNQIAEAAHCSAKTVFSLIDGTSQKVHRKIEAKILGTDPRSLRQPALAYVDSTGTIRRARALFTIGHKTFEIAAAIGIEPVALSRILNREPALVRAYTAQAMAVLYDEWSRKNGPSKRNLTLAAQRGWHGPDAWDDDIDDPNAVPNAEMRLGARELAAERLNDMVLLASAGHRIDHIAQRIGISVDQVRKRLSSEYPHLYLALIA